MSTSADTRFAAVSLEFEIRDVRDPDVVRMVEAVQREYVAMYGGPDQDAIALDEFAPPTGLFLVGVLDGRAVATGGWRWQGDPANGLAEIKRMYVSPSGRGRGLSRRVLAELECRAAAAGVRRIELSTGARQQRAIALYRTAGYADTAPFGHYADSPTVVFLGKNLASAG
jgi:ribosomal protein S18 acetylase RimI-like enzyme